jgi:hypothetical protein
VQRGEVGHCVAFLCEEKISWYRLWSRKIYMFKTLPITKPFSFTFTSLPQTCVITCCTKYSCTCLQCQLHSCILKQVFATYCLEHDRLGMFWLNEAGILIVSTLIISNINYRSLGISESDYFSKIFWGNMKSCGTLCL